MRLATSMALLRTQLFISHNNVVSMFDIIGKKMTKHFYFSVDIDTIFDSSETRWNCRIERINVVLSNGENKSIEI